MTSFADYKTDVSSKTPDEKRQILEDLQRWQDKYLKNTHNDIVSRGKQYSEVLRIIKELRQLVRLSSTGAKLESDRI